jgi:hypothetical protein
MTHMIHNAGVSRHIGYYSDAIEVDRAFDGFTLPERLASTPLESFRRVLKPRPAGATSSQY